MLRGLRVREIALVVIGVTTPVGIIAVNAAAFVMQHLAEFRVFLTAAALISSLLLNGLAGGWALGAARRTAPLLYVEYKRVIWVAAIVAVLLVSYLAAYFTYLGLEDARRLPSTWGILGSLWALLTPFAFTYFDQRFLRKREVTAEEDEERERRRRASARTRRV